MLEITLRPLTVNEENKCLDNRRLSPVLIVSLSNMAPLGRPTDTRVVQKVLSLIGFLSFIQMFHCT